MLQLVYDSMTGNVRRFAGLVAREVGDIDLLDARQQSPQREFLLLTYTFGTGEVPASTRQFLHSHAPLLRGVVASGSFHWGKNFARAADLIAAEHHVPIVAKLNKGGTGADRERVVAWLREQENGQPRLPPAEPWRRTHGTLD
ncbi:class Ib ribonucleoside-diphosphate reductase assembly flavoprotein NrdI [Deinococcus cavernae]|uniref:Class Ib ribonucleoside-diphosphate reductase assembly flavoprotein NrdI n=1 Tax=Deinococcus cavernae TaxID=2320857 RepID=A0A418UZM9_9DEIO|nr:class Ib ribonucleoside-diphosphate reductase assembly flavoprotein NrdI [Deinococcus cavernae]RJF68918.1 class Ib ribonucleoside-diphosphate reductase assembly flavoprotein NrdI [Deinococcus cavernae]